MIAIATAAIAATKASRLPDELVVRSDTPPSAQATASATIAIPLASPDVR